LYGERSWAYLQVFFDSLYGALDGAFELVVVQNFEVVWQQMPDYFV
jgi:hypothetical protein